MSPMRILTAPLCQLLAACPDAIDRVARAAVTRHPYGFYVIPTGVEFDGVPIRFHAWLAGLRNAQAPVWPEHTHRSTMRSIVLDGWLENAQWMNVRVGFGAPLYTTEIQATVSYLVRSPIEVSIGEPDVARVAAGESYVVPKGVFHDTRVPIDRQCLTLCLFLNDRDGKSVVAGEHDRPDRIETSRVALSEVEKERARAYCLDVLRELMQFTRVRATGAAEPMAARRM